MTRRDWPEIYARAKAAVHPGTVYNQGEVAAICGVKTPVVAAWTTRVFEFLPAAKGGRVRGYDLLAFLRAMAATAPKAA